MQDLNALINFFDQICLEDSLYFAVPDAYGRQTYEFHWERLKGSQPWRVRMLGSNNWHHFKAENLMGFIQSENIDVSAMAKELAGSLLTQAVFARTLLRGVEELLGKERVDEAEKQTQMFVEQLRQMATSHAKVQTEAPSVHKQVLPPVPTFKPMGLRLVRPDAEAAN